MTKLIQQRTQDALMNQAFERIRVLEALVDRGSFDWSSEQDCGDLPGSEVGSSGIASALEFGSYLQASQTGSGASAVVRVDACAQGLWGLLSGVDASTGTLPASGQIDVGFTLFNRSDGRVYTDTDSEGDTNVYWTQDGPVHVLAGVQVRDITCATPVAQTSVSSAVFAFNPDASTAYGIGQSWYGTTAASDANYWLSNSLYYKRFDFGYVRLVLRVFNKTAGDLCINSAYLTLWGAPTDGQVETVY